MIISTLYTIKIYDAALVVKTALTKNEDVHDVIKKMIDSTFVLVDQNVFIPPIIASGLQTTCNKVWFSSLCKKSYHFNVKRLVGT